MASDREEELLSQRGDDTKRLMEDPVLMQAFADLENGIIQKMKQLSFNDLEGRDALWRQLKSLAAIKLQLEKQITRGNQAKTTLLQRAKQFIGD